jgi:GTP-binding protein SAR1
MLALFDLWASFLASLWSALGLKGKHGNLLLLGLDNAGKTTLLERLKTGAIRSYPPTDRPSLTEHFTHQGISFTAWDLGGHEAVRHLWGDYVCNAKALLFLVDASDSERLEESGYELDHLIGEGLLEDKPIAVLYNKCDLETALSSSEIAEKLQFQDLVQLHGTEKIRVFRISVLRGEGYQEALKWISSFL